MIRSTSGDNANTRSGRSFVLLRDCFFMWKFTLRTCLSCRKRCTFRGRTFGTAKDETFVQNLMLQQICSVCEACDTFLIFSSFQLDARCVPGKSNNTTETVKGTVVLGVHIYLEMKVRFIQRKYLYASQRHEVQQVAGMNANFFLVERNQKINLEVIPELEDNWSDCRRNE